jgi:hypothetical protein
VKIISIWSNQLDISKKIEWLSKIVWWWNWEENDVIEKIIGDWKKKGGAELKKKLLNFPCFF